MSTQASNHKTIEATMGCLDLTLESELTLFRNRYAQTETQEQTFQAEQDSADLDIPANNVRTRLDSPISDTVEAQSGQVAEPPVENWADLDVSQPSMEPESDESLGCEGAIETDFRDMAVPESSEEEILSGAIIPSHAVPPPASALSSSATLETYTDPALDDYLQSSEVLLKHLDAPAPKRKSSSSQWFTLTAAAILALSGLAAFFLQSVFRTPQPSATAPNEPETASQSSSKAYGGASGTTDNPASVNSPDLSTKEFKSVKPGNLAELPTAPANAGGRTGSSADSNATPSETVAPQTSTPSAPSPAPNPPSTPTPPSVQTSVSPVTGRQFYVVTEYGSEESLAAAQKVVRDARVVNFTAGTRVLLQQFSDESTARTAAADFRQQGLSVEILATAEQ